MSHLVRMTGVQHVRETADEAVGVRASNLFVAFTIALLSIAFIAPIGDAWVRSTFDEYVDAATTEEGARDGNMSRQLAFAGLALFGMLAIAWPGGKELRIDNGLALVCLAYIGWCAVTCLVAEDLMMSAKRWVVLLCECIAGLGIAKRCSARQFVFIVFACTLFWFGFGMLAELSHGTFRPWSQGYRFAGIFHPNEMGIDCAILTMSALYLAAGGTARNRLLLAAAAVGFVFVFLSGSRTAAGALMVSVAALWLLMTPRLTFILRSLAVTCGAATVGLLFAFGMFDVNQDLVNMGRVDNDVSSLTGRMPLWSELVGYAQLRPWTGYGYNAFWTSDRIAEVSHSQQWTLSSAHNTYIDLLLNIGWIGVALCLASMLWAAARGAALEQRQPKAGYGFIAMIVIYGLASGALETTIGMTWFLSFLGICGVCYVALCRERQCTQAAVAFGKRPQRSRPYFASPGESLA